MSDDPPEQTAPEPGHYEIGYGKPPRHSRFHKGQSGNPKGRPPQSKNLSTLITNALDERVAVTENGRRRTVTKRQAIVTQLVNKSAAADLKAMAMLIGLLPQVEAAAALRRTALDGFSETDEQVLQGLRERIAVVGDDS